MTATPSNPVQSCQPTTEPPRTPISPVATREDLIAMIHNRDALASDLKSAHATLTARVAELEKALRDIMKATVEGRVCDDVAWFDSITTLHDFCDLVLNGPGQTGGAKG